MSELTVGIWEYDAAGKVWTLVADLDPFAPQSPVSQFAMEPRFNAAGPWSMTLPMSVLDGYDPDDDIPHLLVTADFRDTRETGCIDGVEERFDDDGLPVYSLSGTTAFGLLGDATGFPNPGQPVDGQISVRRYLEGPAEDVIATIVRENLVDRLGYDLQVATSQGRGGEVTVNSEFTNLLELVTDAAMLGGVGVKVGLVNRAGSNSRADLRVTFYLPTDRSADNVFSRDGQSLLAYTRKWTRGTADRAIVQGAREQESRQIASVNVSANSITTAGERKTKNREVESVNVSANSITTKSAHEMPTGSRIEFTGGNPPAPLETGQTYYSIKVDSNTLRVSRSRGGGAVTLTNSGSGQIVVTRVTLKPVKHRLRTGDIITFSGGTPPEPLETGVAFHAVRVDDNTFKVALTRGDAARGTIIALTSQHEGDVSVTEQTRRYKLVETDANRGPFGRVREILHVGNAEDRENGLAYQGREALRDGYPQTAVELQTTEVPGNRYADPVNLGDTVAFVSPSGKERKDIIGAARLTLGDGLVVEMIPGNPDATSPERQQAADYRRIRRRTSRARED